jgi:hypothetical protein
MRHQKLTTFWLVLSVIFIGCLNNTESYSDSKLISDIDRTIANNKVLNLQTITPFAWDKLYIFTPYTSEAEIKKCLGFNSEEVGDRGVQSDSINLMVFVKDGKAIEHLEYPRSKGDFVEIKNCQNFTPETALFTVKTDKSGYSRLLPQAK